MKWIGALSLLLLLTGAALLLLIRREMTRSLRAALESKGHAVAHSLVHQGTDAILTRSKLRLRSLLDDTKEGSGDVRYILIEIQGHVLAHTFGEGIPEVLSEWVRKGGKDARFESGGGSILNVTAPIEYEEGGTLHLGLSENPIDKEVRGALLRVGAIFGVIYLFGLAGVIVLGSVVTRPVRNLALRAEKIASGDLVPRVTATGQDEVGTLARTIDSMRERVTRTERLAEVGMMSSWVAHEINNPLDGVRESVRIVQADPTQVGEFLPLIDEALGRIETVVKKLLAYAYKPNFQIKPVDPAAVIEASCMELARRTRVKTVHIERSLPEEPAPIQADPRALQQILTNLLFNAVDAVRDGGHVHIQYEGGSDRVCFRVRDDGIGMTPEELSVVKEPFFTSKPAGLGTGLGLTVCINLAEAHGGHLEIDSTPGLGTKVSVHLPRT
jgi:signal transduction histidine kinase